MFFYFPDDTFSDIKLDVDMSDKIDCHDLAKQLS